MTEVTERKVWELVRAVSLTTAGDATYEAEMKAGFEWVDSLGEADRAKFDTFNEALEAASRELSNTLAKTVVFIIEMNNLPLTTDKWREADLFTFLGAAQKYEMHELLVSAILAQPNVELFMEILEPQDV